MEEDNFRVRVDKIFGALGGGGGGGNTWSPLTHQDRTHSSNHHRTNQQQDDDDESGPSDPLPSKDLHDLSDCEDDDDDDDDEIERGIVDEKEEEDWDIKSNIGRDCTLDFEEEEDEYDKVALGSKQTTTDNFLYMKDVKTADYELDTSTELPITFHAVARDPRANHAAAKIRLKEDAEASDNFDTLQLSDTSVKDDAKKKDGDNPKPILKKRETLVDSRSQKRVRFLCEPGSSLHNEEQPVSGVGHLALRHDVADGDQVSGLSQYSFGVPDYVNNPSKYTRYTFDSSDDMDHQSNQKAYMDLFQYIRKRNTDSSSVDDTCDVPKSVTFIPKVKPEDNSNAKMSESEHSTEDDLKNKGWSIGVTAEGAQESEVSAMDEDESCLAVDKARTLQKPGRQYRARTSINVEDNLT